MEAECGLQGFAVLIKLWQKIYSEGYYIDWKEDNAILFSRKINSELTLVNSVVTSCLSRGIFNNELYTEYKILTSKAIQKRYLMVCKQLKRSNVSFISEYLLVSSELTQVISELTPINSEFSTQRKGKEKKGEEKKGNEIVDKITAADYLKFFNNNFHLITSFEKQKLQGFEDDGMEAEVILMALQESVNANVRDMRYVNKILSTWLDKNIKTVESVKADKLEYERKKAKEANKNGSKSKDTFNNYEQRDDCLDQYKQLEQQAMEELSGEELNGQALLDEIRNKGAD